MFRKLFGLHEHTWSKWEVTHSFLSERWAVRKIIQQRQCSTCGKVEINSQETL